ncbi:GNAT family N-acetyltransferase [Streptomyces catenulae]|uniref:GNAT family N-acetyltransferase n=1 Tax=Streptomyces catenulae TaxID=66875 RepID=A0ABV2YXF6_9ACTN|nr:GNAT family N-acetyltransferase [Streptomyces catenulae]
MAFLEDVVWPPAPLRTERLVLREPEVRDRTAFLALLASPEVHTYLGGPRPRDELEREMPGAPTRRPGLFVVERDGAMIGQITLTEESGLLPRAAGRAELGYLFLPEAWGRGYATEACTAVLDWFTGVLPGRPVVLATQTANTGSRRLAAKLGFVEAGLFHAYGAEQWCGVWSPAAAPGPNP